MFIIPLSQLPAVTEAGNAASASKGAGTLSGAPFADVLSQAVQNMAQTQEQSQKDAYELALGQTDDLHTIQINSMKAAAAVDFAVGLTSKVLTAYNEIIRMQI